MNLLKSTLTLGLIFAASISSAQVALSQSGLSAALQAKVKATTLLLDSAESFCTVSPVTPNGFLLTALHCVRGCLLSSQAGEEGAVPTMALHDLFVSTKSSQVNVNCPDLSIPALNIKGVTVVATGRALSVFESDFMFDFAPLFGELKAQGFTSRGNDFALLKIKTAVDLPCWPISTSPVPANSDVWALGYPRPEDEKQAPILLSSRGQVYRSASESFAFRSADSEIQKSYLNELYSESSVIYSNAVTQYGQSGGPIISAAGELVGVVSGYTNTPKQGAPEVHELVGAAASAFAKQLPSVVVNASAKCSR